MVSSTRFDFDDQLQDSNAYRRALTNIQRAKENQDRRLQDALSELYDMPVSEGPQSAQDNFQKIQQTDADLDREPIETLYQSAVQSARRLSNERFPLPRYVAARSSEHIGDAQLAAPKMAPWSSKSDWADIKPQTSKTQQVKQGTTHDMDSDDGASWTKADDGASWGKELISDSDNTARNDDTLNAEDATSLSPPLIPGGAVSPSLPREGRLSRFFSKSLRISDQTASKRGNGQTPSSSEQPKKQPMSDSAEIRRKLVILGDTGTGKSCLLVQLSKGTFVESWTSTIFDNYVADVECDGKHIELALWDTAGMYDYDHIRPFSYPDSHVILVCFSIDRPDSLDNIEEKVCTQQYNHNHRQLGKLTDRNTTVDLRSVAFLPGLAHLTRRLEERFTARPGHASGFAQIKPEANDARAGRGSAQKDRRLQVSGVFGENG